MMELMPCSLSVVMLQRASHRDSEEAERCILSLALREGSPEDRRGGPASLDFSSFYLLSPVNAPLSCMCSAASKAFPRQQTRRDYEKPLARAKIMHSANPLLLVL